MAKREQMTTILMDTNSKAWKRKMADIKKRLAKKYDGFDEKMVNVGYRARMFNSDFVLGK